MTGLVPFGSGFPFDSFFDDFLKPAALNRTGFGTFKLDVREEEKSYLIEADLPGVSKEDVSLSLRDGTLEISVSREESKESGGEGASYLHRERRFASCKRSVYLGDTDPQNVTAKLENGVLTINVPKLSKIEQSHNIQIQ